MQVRLFPSQLGGTMAVPPSKSMAHRLLFCAALAEGESTIENLALSEDIKATLAALNALGAEIEITGNRCRVRGMAGRPRLPKVAIDCAESGSTLRFLIPLCSLAPGRVRLTGAPRLFQRPLAAYESIFAQNGLLFEKGVDSLTLEGPLPAGQYALPGDVSSQFITGLLFALPLLGNDSEIQIAPPFESRSYVGLTRQAQSNCGVASEWDGERRLVIRGKQRYRRGGFAVEGDWSQAVVPAVLGAAAGPLHMAGLREDSLQGDRALLAVLERAGALLRWEPGAALRAAPPAEGLHSPGLVDLADCPDLGPVLCAFALFCRGKTTFINAGRLRIKESDRIAAIQAELGKMGAHVSSTGGTIEAEGGRPLKSGAVVQSHNDHRIAMALATAALAGGLALTIEDADAVAKSWPGFFDDLRAVGARLEFL